jgi:hypothetical protein
MTGSNGLVRWRSRRFRVALIALILISTGLAIGQRRPTVPASESAAPREPSTSDLAGFLRALGRGIDFEPSDSPDDLASRSSVTVSGTIKEIVDGRVFGVGSSRDVEPRFLTIGILVKVEQVLSGDRSLLADDSVYLEISRSKDVSIQSVQRATPVDQRVLLFLDDYSQGPKPFSLVQESSIGPRQVVFAPYTEGFLLEDRTTGAVTGGLESIDELGPAWQRDRASFDRFVAGLTRLNGARRSN